MYRTICPCGNVSSLQLCSGYSVCRVLSVSAAKHRLSVGLAAERSARSCPRNRPSSVRRAGGSADDLTAVVWRQPLGTRRMRGRYEAGYQARTSRRERRRRWSERGTMPRRQHLGSAACTVSTGNAKRQDSADRGRGAYHPEIIWRSLRCSVRLASVMFTRCQIRPSNQHV